MLIKEYLKVIGLGLVWFLMNWKTLVFYVLWAGVTLVALFEDKSRKASEGFFLLPQWLRARCPDSHLIIDVIDYLFLM